MKFNKFEFVGVILLVSLLNISFINSSIQIDAATEQIKIMTYNIEESGKNSDWIQVVKEENPDIVVFVETGAWDDNNNFLLNQYCTELNNFFTNENPYYCDTAQGIEYETSGEAIMSRYPILSVVQIPLVILDDGSIHDVSHDFMDWTIDLSTTNVQIIGAHLKCCSGDPENEDKRDMQQEGIINYMDDLGDVPIMYMGDLNSFSPVDVEDPNLEPDRSDLGWGPMTMMIRPSDTIYGSSSSLIHTWVDVFREINPTDPGYTYGHQANNLDGRIDFITFNQHFDIASVVSSTVGDTNTASTGSDHYSVDFIMEYNGGSSDDTTPPAQVTGLLASTFSNSQIDLTWDANTESDLSYYKVYRDGGYLTLTTSNSFSDSGLSASTTYTYEISAVDTTGNEGQKSSPASATTLEDTGGSDTMHVYSITFDQDYIRGRNPYYRLSVFIKIVAQNDNPLGDVSVTIEWMFPDGSITMMIATSGSDGVATFMNEPVDQGLHTITVNDAELSGYTYNSGANVETTDSFIVG